MDEYIDKNQQKRLKDMLYGYLKDKAQRRQGITSRAEYEGAEENFAKQMRLSDAGSLIGAMSEGASMAGTLGGKRAQSDIIPEMNKGLYNSTQGAYENFRTLRDTEERANMNDLNVARYLTDLERSNDQMKLANRQQDFRERQEPAITKRRFQSELVSPEGDPVVMDESGNPMPLPGYKLRQKPVVGGSMSVVPGFEADGKILMRDAQGNLVSKDLPAGFTPKKNANSEVGPVEKAQISSLGTKVANQASIVNVLVPARDRLLEALRAGNKDLAIKIGQGMIKALNSDQGPDAVGVEEANRIGNLLEFQILNFTQPGPVFGRDLDGFAQQVDATIDKMKKAVVSGQQQLKQLESGQPIQFRESSGGGMSSEQKARLEQLRAKYRK